MTTANATFWNFYSLHYLDEHRHPANQALHVMGTVGSAGFLMWAVWAAPLWLPVYFPIHALPGLLGHRLFERSAAAGDLRLNRKDFPLFWFIAANHVLVWSLARRLILPRGRE